MKTLLMLFAAGLLFTGTACNNGQKEENNTTGDTSTVPAPNAADTATLPPPYATDTVKNYSNVKGWKKGQTPTAPEGFQVSAFAADLQNPRWIYIAPNGDILVAEAGTKSSLVEKVKAVASGKQKSGNSGSADRITLFRDTNGDGKPDLQTVFLKDLNQPFGMLILGDKFYVANTDAVLVFPYQQGQTSINSKGKKILDLPKGGYNNHWTRNLVSNADGSKIYVSVGSGSNAAEHGMENEIRRANILEINPDGSGERIYASGLRNPVGMDWAPGTKTLWVVVNERDNLGDNLVPDYLTHVEPDGFYGWPYAYFGPHEDPRLKGQRPDLVSKTIVPDVPLLSHTASLGFTFYEGSTFPEKYHNGAFIGQHGSWNSSTPVGYKVVFIPFSNGKTSSGQAEDFLTGFMADAAQNEVYGRPVGVNVAKDGALLVADDAGNTIWRVSRK